MAFAIPTRPLTAAASICRSCRQHLQRHQTFKASTASRTASRQPDWLSTASGQSNDDLSQAKPRWAQTPGAMRAPHRTRPKSENDEFPCNDDPRLLDEAYVKFLGKEGDKMLTEEIKWLAVTHKSFDHGRRGFNERLAFLGRRIVELQTSLALLDAPQSESTVRSRDTMDIYGRMPFQHGSLQNVENVAIHVKERILDRQRLAQLAQRYGLGDVARWKPRQVKDLRTSGFDTVLRDTIFAIIGAIALQKGGEIANQTVRQRILNPLGVV